MDSKAPEMATNPTRRPVKPFHFIKNKRSDTRRRRKRLIVSKNETSTLSKLRH